MILYVTFAQTDERANWAATYARHAERFEAASAGQRCLILPYDMADASLIARLQPTAVILSGFARSFEDYRVEDLMPIANWTRDNADIPTLAICGSHQLIGMIFNGEVDGAHALADRPMRPRRPGEPITNPDYHPDYFMERGFYELTIVEDDPLFAHCGQPPVMLESHYCEIKRLPEGFRLLASTPECRIQAMRHGRLPLVGVQFHPEDYTDRFPDGRYLLEAFLRCTNAQPAPSIATGAF
ncbi:MAG: gamma-glutamyl-gamma-aminobutyrate hydrolase family protein [Chthonomonadales bacterium]|nr:gamma-glutamyl-gamma-aminobutyrate hydrolase family protein [Chthonomonadales bacterium]